MANRADILRQFQDQAQTCEALGDIFRRKPSGRMDLTIWPTGETVTLGRGDFHGRWAEWA